MKLTLCVDRQNRGSPSKELKEYIIDIGCPLRSVGDVFDELKISTNDDNVLVGQITRRCYVDKYGVLRKLNQEEIQELDVPEITFFEGTNYVYIKEFYNLNMKVEYLTNAEMNKYFATKMEMNSSIKQTADSINLELSKKVGSDEIIAKINMSPEEIQILANKLGLTANDVINIIAGNEINLTSKNISITSDNFSVDKNGHLICVGADFQNGDINTDKDAYVGDNLYIGQNQNGNADLVKFLYFSQNAWIKRWIFPDGGNYLRIQSDLNTTIACNDNVYVRIWDSGIDMSHNPNISSDERLKKDIKDLNVDWIRNLKIKEFKYKNVFDKTFIGLIAQDYLNEEFSKYFLSKNDDGYYSINYSNITNALIKYSQNLEDKINKLEKRIKKLEVLNNGKL